MSHGGDRRSIALVCLQCGCTASSVPGAQGTNCCYVMAAVHTCVVVDDVDRIRADCSFVRPGLPALQTVFRQVVHWRSIF